MTGLSALTACPQGAADLPSTPAFAHAQVVMADETHNGLTARVRTRVVGIPNAGGPNNPVTIGHAISIACSFNSRGPTQAPAAAAAPRGDVRTGTR
jgi:hypothetical protein